MFQFVCVEKVGKADKINTVALRTRGQQRDVVISIFPSKKGEIRKKKQRTKQKNMQEQGSWSSTATELKLKYRLSRRS